MILIGMNVFIKIVKKTHTFCAKLVAVMLQKNKELAKLLNSCFSVCFEPPKLESHLLELDDTVSITVLLIVNVHFCKTRNHTIECERTFGMQTTLQSGEKKNIAKGL